MPEAKSPMWSTVLSILVAISLSLSGWGLNAVNNLQTSVAQHSISIVTNGRRLDSIEAGGSPTMQAALKTLLAEIEARKDSDGALSKRVDEVRMDFNQRVQNITELLKEQVKQQTELISLIRAQQQIK